jgi:hypothetical protein
VLQEELGVEPDPSTRRQYEQLMDLEALAAAQLPSALKNCLKTLKTRCFTDDLPQRTLGGRPVHGEAVTIAGVSLLG